MIISKSDAIIRKLSRYIFVFKCKLIILTMFALAPLCASAQYDVNFAHYFDMEPWFNPASVGKEDKLNVTVAYAMDLAGFEHNPKTMYAAGDLPFYLLRQYHGVGVQLMNDQLGLFTHQRLGVQYAFRHKLFGGKIAAGAQLTLLSEKFDGSKLDIEDTSDPAFTKSSIDGSGFDVGVGVYYQRGPWYAGVSGQHLNAPTVRLGETSEIKIDPSFYLTGGYNIKLRNPFLNIKTSFLVRTDLVVYRGDVTARLVYTNDTKMMYGGLSYSPTNSITFLIGGKFHGVVLGYSYEYYTTPINPGNGSHELYAGYQVDIDFQKKGRNKHKSVRIL